MLDILFDMVYYDYKVNRQEGRNNMKLEEMLKFNGSASQFEEYEQLLIKRDKLERKLKRLSDKLQDEDDSLSVFEGELSEHDMELFKKHVQARKELYAKWYTTQKSLEHTLKLIWDMQSKEK